MSIESMGLQSQTQFEQMNNTTYKSSSVWVVLGCSGVILGEFGVLLRAPPKPFPWEASNTSSSCPQLVSYCAKPPGLRKCSLKSQSQYCDMFEMRITGIHWFRVTPVLLASFRFSKTRSLTSRFPNLQSLPFGFGREARLGFKASRDIGSVVWPPRGTWGDTHWVPGVSGVGLCSRGWMGRTAF